MRNTLLTLLVAALALPGAALASRAAPGDGTLSVEGGNGVVIVQARGGVIGRVDSGAVVITDLTPGDGNDPVVWGAQFRRQTGPGTFTFRGRNITFRLIGGGFKVTVRGLGISLSAVGRGNVFLDGEGPDAGVFSTAGADCKLAPETCRPLPEGGLRIRLGGPQQPERSGPGEKQPGPNERQPSK